MLIAIAIAEEIQGFQRIALKFCFWVFFDLGKKFELYWFDLRWVSVVFSLRFENLKFRSCFVCGEYGFMWGTKTKEIHPSSNQNQRKLRIFKTSVQSFVILGYPLQWRWQWASTYRTLLLLFFFSFFLKISLLEMPIAFGNEHLTSK